MEIGDVMYRLESDWNEIDRVATIRFIPVKIRDIVDDDVLVENIDDASEPPWWQVKDALWTQERIDKKYFKEME